MRVHYIQHVPFEGLGSMGPALEKRGCTLTSTHLHKGQTLPADDAFDWLIVMGGPMSIYDEDKYPWLKDEKAFIRRAIDGGKKILGVCLGAQLIADAMGAKVTRNDHREIGWHTISPTPGARDTILSPVLSNPAEVFHWHGDTFDIPEGATHIASSDACKNQAFIADDRIVAFQFHLETTPISASALIHECGEDLNSSLYVQSGPDMMGNEHRFTHINYIMDRVIGTLHDARQGTA